MQYELLEALRVGWVAVVASMLAACGAGAGDDHTLAMGTAPAPSQAVAPTASVAMPAAPPIEAASATTAPGAGDVADASGAAVSHGATAVSRGRTAQAARDAALDRAPGAAAGVVPGRDGARIGAPQSAPGLMPAEGTAQPVVIVVCGDDRNGAGSRAATPPSRECVAGDEGAPASSTWFVSALPGVDGRSGSFAGTLPPIPPQIRCPSGAAATSRENGPC